MGDIAIQTSVIRNLRMRYPDVEIFGICQEPEATAASLGVPTFGLCHSAWAISRFVRSLDLLIVSGGGQLDDYWGGAWAHPYSMLLWSLLARVYGVMVVFLGVGLDRLSTPLSRMFCLTALRLAHYRAFRDVGTLTEMRTLGLRAPCATCPDLAFATESDRLDGPSVEETRPFVVVNPISRATWSHESDVRHAAYLRNLAAACEWLVGQKLRVRIVCSQGAMDNAVAAELVGMVPQAIAAEMEHCRVVQVPDFMNRVRGAQLVIASRLHGAILSMVAGVPVVAISPQPKVRQQMVDAGLGEYVIDLQDFDQADLVGRVRGVLANELMLRRIITERTQAFRMDLARTFDEVVALLESHRVPEFT